MMITDATNIPHAALCAAMNDAFSDYVAPMQLTEDTFTLMMHQRGFTPAASRVAHINGEIAAIWLTALRGTKAYLISSGTRPAFRSQGLARQLAEASLAHLKAAGAASFQTEVIDSNHKAAALYHKLGMTVARPLDCYSIGPQPEQAAHAPEPCSWSDIAPDAPALRSWPPSWQNDDASLSAASDTLLCARATDAQGLAAYAALLPATNTLAQIATRKDRRREGLAKSLIHHLQNTANVTELRVINADGRDSGFTNVMSALSAKPFIRQHELFMPLKRFD